MKTSIEKMLRWFCRKMTSNEFASAVLIIHEILSGKRSDFEFKPEEPERTANYRRFAYDLLPPLTKPPETTAAEPSDNWRRLLAEHEERHGRKLKPVRRKQGGFEVPEHSHCEHCGAPSPYLTSTMDAKATRFAARYAASFPRQTGHAAKRRRSITAPIADRRSTIGKTLALKPFTNVRTTIAYIIRTVLRG